MKISPWLTYPKIYKTHSQKFDIKYWNRWISVYMLATGILLTFYCTKISAKSSFKISHMDKVLTLPPMRVNAIFLRVSIKTPVIRCKIHTQLNFWTFWASYHYKNIAKMLFFRCDRAGPYNILSFERCLCKRHVNVHFCQAWWVKNVCIHCKTH